MEGDTTYAESSVGRCMLGLVHGTRWWNNTKGVGWSWYARPGMLLFLHAPPPRPPMTKMRAAPRLASIIQKWAPFRPVAPFGLQSAKCCADGDDEPSVRTSFPCLLVTQLVPYP